MYEQTELDVLTMRRLPARLNVEQTAKLLGFTDLEMPILMKMKPKPLLPPPNGHKFFATEEILQLAANRDWLAKASKAVTAHWKVKNQRHQHLVTVGSASSSVRRSPRPIPLSA